MPTIRAKDLTGTMTSFGNSDFIAGDENASNETKKINSEAIRAGMAVATPSAKGLMPAEINTHFDTDDSSRLKATGVSDKAIGQGLRKYENQIEGIGQLYLTRKNFIKDPYYNALAVPYISGPVVDSEGYEATANITRTLVTNTLIMEPGVVRAVEHTITTSWAGAYFLQYRLGINNFNTDDFYVLTKKMNFTMELVCDHDVTIHPRLYRHEVTPSAYTIIHDLGSISLTANQKKVIHFYASVPDLSNVDMLMIYLFYDGAHSEIYNYKFYVGRIFAYAGEQISLTESKIHTSRVSGLTSNTQNIILWGDSITANSVYAAKLGLKFTDSNIYNAGVGSQLSYHIKERVINDTDHKDWFSILWIGRNNDGNNDFTERILIDLREIVNYLEHGNFLILSPLNGDYVSDRKPEKLWQRFIELGDRLRAIYGPRYLDIREYLISQYDYKDTKLMANYTQPSVGSNVTIEVNKNDWLSVNDEIAVGYHEYDVWPYADYYTVISKPDSTHLTIRLDTARIVTPGNTVSNITSTIGGTTATNPQRIYLKQDLIDRVDDIIPKTMRTDNIHLQDFSYDYVVEAIYKHLTY